MFGTWYSETHLCKNCRIEKLCKHWTNRWEKEDDEAEKQIEKIVEEAGLDNGEAGVEMI